jgi:hypothetical protein
MRKKAVIDIDNTLWHFCDVLYERLRRVNAQMPSPESWIHWDFWIHYCSEAEFMAAINGIHLTQDLDEHLPYPEAKEFLLQVKKQNYHIVIASHRATESLEQTERWLTKHDLIYDEIYLSFDKTVLFDENCHIVVDDSPNVLERAVEKGVTATGLLFPWNRAHQNNGYQLFDTLDEILHFILSNGNK